MDDFRRAICEGDLYQSADGHKMGRIARCGAEHFEVEHGFFFPRESLVSYADVAEMRGKVAVSRFTRAEIEDRWSLADKWGPGTHPPQQA